jgi:hypothetical protein
VAQKFKELEGRVDKHDSDIQKIFDAIRKMLTIEEKPKRKIGFQVPQAIRHLSRETCAERTCPEFYRGSRGKSRDSSFGIVLK